LIPVRLRAEAAERNIAATVHPVRTQHDEKTPRHAGLFPAFRIRLRRQNHTAFIEAPAPAKVADGSQERPRQACFLTVAFGGFGRLSRGFRNHGATTAPGRE
jgi:hypothetical protein